MVRMMRNPATVIAPLVPETNRDYAYSLFKVVDDPAEKVDLASNLTRITKEMAMKVKNIATLLTHPFPRQKINFLTSL
jgi:hypothetical protein